MRVAIIICCTCVCVCGGGGGGGGVIRSMGKVKMFHIVDLK